MFGAGKCTHTFPVEPGCTIETNANIGLKGWIVTPLVSHNVMQTEKAVNKEKHKRRKEKK